MGTHLIPRQIDGDGRILLIFTPKGFIGTIIGIVIGTFFYSFATALGSSIVGWVLLAICAAIGFIIGQVKIPDSNSFDLFKKTGGEYVSNVIKNYFAFQKKKKIYLYDEFKTRTNITNVVEEIQENAEQTPKL